MLNLLFAFDPLTDGIGLFSEYEDPNRPSNPLLMSKHWLKLNTDSVLHNFTPDNLPPGLNWEDLGPAGTLLIPSTAHKHTIGIRIAEYPTGRIAAGATGELVVAFGRPVIAKQPHGSPFVVGDYTETKFYHGPGSRIGGAPSWFFKIGNIATVPGHENVTHRYEFALGFNVVSNGVTRSYGEDPEFDVGL